MKKSFTFVFVIVLAFSPILGGCTEMSDSMKVLEGKNGVFAVMETSKGDIVLELYYKETPLTVTNFVGLAEGTLVAAKGKPFYNGLKFHRVIENFMIQGGDPQGTGSGGPGYQFADEIVKTLTHSAPGVLSMANAGAGTNGSQFFITHVETPWLDGKHTIFGKVVNGQKVVDSIKQGDLIKKVTIVRNGDDAKKFTAAQADFDLLNAEVSKKATETAKEEQIKAAKILDEKYGDFTKTNNGLRYKITKQGSGAKVGSDKTVFVHYTGKLMNDTVFDSSLQSEPISFVTNSGQLIPGFDLMVQDMKKGEKRTIVIPPELGYGATGAGGVIPPNAHIAFELEVTDIK